MGILTPGQYENANCARRRCRMRSGNKDCTSIMHVLKAITRTVSVLLLILATVFKLGWNGGELHYSATLTKSVTEAGNVERIDYLDDRGEPAFAEDLHYSSAVSTKDDAGRVISVFYFDETGKPAVQPEGYCGLIRQYDAFGQNNRVVYTDSQGNPMMTDLGYAMREYVRDEEGRAIEHWYLDADGKPVANSDGAYGRLNLYDALGRRVASTYVDGQKRPYRTAQGFATVKREFYWNGALKRAFYFDEEGNPAPATNGQYGFYYEYDDQGREAVTTFIDSEGRPMVAGAGYATVKRAYDDVNGTVEREMYYDAEGNPACLKKGQYGMRFEGIYHIYLDANGQDKFSPYTVIYNNPLLVVLFGLLICAISMSLNKRGNALLLSGYLFFILFMTLMNRNATGTTGGAAFLWSYRKFFRDAWLRQEIINNVWLFIPLGTILYRLMGWTGLLAALGLSAAIEIMQYTTGFGLAEFDDLLSNGLGSFTGCGLADLAGHWRRTAPPNPPDQGRGRTGGAAFRPFL